MMLFSFLLFLTVTITACQGGDSNDPNTSNNPDPVPDPDNLTHELFTEGDNVALNPDFTTVIRQGIEIRSYQSDGSVKYTDSSKIPPIIFTGGSVEIDIGDHPVNTGIMSSDGDLWIKGDIFEDGQGRYTSDNNLIVEGISEFAGTENSDSLRLHAGNILYVEEAIKGLYIAWNTAIIDSVENGTIEAPNIKAQNVTDSFLEGLSITVKNFGGAIQFDSRDIDRDVRDVANNTNTRMSGVVQGGSLVLGKLYRGDEYIDLSKMDSVEYNDSLNVGGGWNIDPDKIQISLYKKVYVDAQHLAVIHIENLSGTTTVVTNDPHLDVATARNVYGWWGVDEVINVSDLETVVSEFFD